MTHTRNPSASSAVDRTIPSVSPPTSDPEGGSVDREEASVDREEASVDREEASVDREDRSTRARTESMTVRPLRDRRYVVETAGGTYVVALDAGTCTCPDHAIRGSHCKHLRRVAMEVTDGTVPAPDERVGVCAVCGGETFVPSAATGPALCEDHGHDPGAIVRDRETGNRLVVLAVTDERADEYRTEENRIIASYPTNADYGAHEPVVEAVYVESLRPESDGRGITDAKRYGFPASRLVRVAGDRR
ncbi:hypothetical protein [Halorubrum sp. DTA98]|uniref:hypothetical protein n=1 Tax=Halorubrum sp. DTA98 TaxID=3402163 RepID=UPI003AAD0F2F